MDDDLLLLAKDICALDKCYKQLEERMNILNHKYDSLKYLLEDWAETAHPRIKIPHRCPVCNGTTIGISDELCTPCDGKGIVWG